MVKGKVCRVRNKVGEEVEEGSMTGGRRERVCVRSGVEE